MDRGRYRYGRAVLDDRDVVVVTERGVCICPECGCQFSDDQKARMEAVVRDASPKHRTLWTALHEVARLPELRAENERLRAAEQRRNQASTERTP